MMRYKKTKLLYEKRLFLFIKEVDGGNIIIENIKNGTRSIIKKHKARIVPGT